MNILAIRGVTFPFSRQNTPSNQMFRVYLTRKSGKNSRRERSKEQKG